MSILVTGGAGYPAGDGRGYSFCGGAEAGRGSGGAGGVFGADSAGAGLAGSVWGFGGYCGEWVEVGEGSRLRWGRG